MRVILVVGAGVSLSAILAVAAAQDSGVGSSDPLADAPVVMGILTATLPPALIGAGYEVSIEVGGGVAS